MSPLEPIYRQLFFVAAVWNVLVGLTGLGFMDQVTQRIYGAKAAAGDVIAQVAWSDFAACVILFGVGYFLVSRDVRKNHAVVVMGVIGKVGVTAAMTLRFLQGTATAWGMLPVLVDLGFALLFGYFLWDMRQGLRVARESSR